MTQCDSGFVRELEQQRGLGHWLRRASAQPAWVCLCLALLSVVLPHALLEVYWETNDDLGMLYMLRGDGAWEPSPHLIMTHVAVGFVLHGAYAAMPELPWYTLYLLTAYTLAIWLSYWALMPQRVTAWRIGLALLLFAVLWFPVVVRLQFTFVSILLALSSTLLIGVLASDTKAATGGWLRSVPWGCWLAAVGLSFAFLIRWNGGLLGMGLALPWLLVLGLQGRRNRRMALAGALPLVIAALSFGAWQLNTAYYERAGYADYFEFARARVPITDSTAGRILASSQYADVGWSSAEQVIFSQWSFMDRSVYTNESMLRLSASLFEQLPSWNTLFERVRQSERDAPLLKVFAGLLFVMGFSRRLERGVLAYVGHLGVAALVVVYVAIYSRPVPRVWIPLHDSFLLGALVWVGRYPARRSVATRLKSLVEPSSARVRARSLLGFACAVSALGVLVWSVQTSIVKHLRFDQSRYARYERALNQYESVLRLPPSANGKPTVVSLGTQFFRDVQTPWDTDHVLGRVNLVMGGWRAFTPEYFQTLERLGLNNPLLDAMNKPGVYLIFGSALLRDMAVEAVRHRYGRSMLLIPVDAPGFEHIYRAVEARDLPRRLSTSVDPSQVNPQLVERQ